MKNTLKFQDRWGDEITIAFQKGTYANNGNLFVEAYSLDENDYFEPYCNITVNFEEKLEEGMAYIDTNNADKELLNAMTREGYMFYMFKDRNSGFCTYPMFCFSEDFLNSIE